MDRQDVVVTDIHFVLSNANSMARARVDVIRFEVDSGQVHIFVNERDLLASLRDVEIAGGVDDSVAGVYQGRKRERLCALDTCMSPPRENTWLLLYTCGACGMVDCGAVWVQAWYDRAFVRWKKFTARPLREGLGPFRFRREQYESALADAWNHLAEQGVYQQFDH